MIGNERGYSLVELLVGLLLFAFFAAAIHQLSVAVMRSTAVLEAAAEAQESVQIGLELMMRELRGSGYSPDGSLGNGLRLAAADAIAVASDLNGDGDTNDASERIAYGINRSRGTLTRATGNAAPQPMLSNIPADGLILAYYAADGQLVGSTEPLSTADLPRVRRVDITLAVEIAHPDPAVPQPIRTVQTASVYLRNGG